MQQTYNTHQKPHSAQEAASPQTKEKTTTITKIIDQNKTKRNKDVPTKKKATHRDYITTNNNQKKKNKNKQNKRQEYKIMTNK
jgi:hypothetical protein